MSKDEIKVSNDLEQEAIKVAQEDFINSQSNDIITDDVILDNTLPQCWDMDRFAHHIR